MGTLANSENPDETFYQGLHCLLSQNCSSEEHNIFLKEYRLNYIEKFPRFMIIYERNMNTIFTEVAGLQIYGGPGSVSHDFKIWPITFQSSGPI